MTDLLVRLAQLRPCPPVQPSQHLEGSYDYQIAMAATQRLDLALDALAAVRHNRIAWQYAQTQGDYLESRRYELLFYESERIADAILAALRAALIEGNTRHE